MARPKKNLNTPEAKERIISSFWELLEEYRFNQITVGMIVGRAQCNRGTFYYHFNDIEDLLSTAIEAETFGDPNIITDFANLIAGTDTDVVQAIFDGGRFDKVFLAVRQGGSEITQKTIKRIVIDMWRMILCPDGGDLTPEARVLLEYTTSGILGIIYYREEARAEGKVPKISAELLGETSRFILEKIGKAQGVPQEEILTRFKILNQFSRISQK